MEAQYTGVGVLVDGWLDEVVWKEATAYPLSLSRDRSGPRNSVEVQEPGSIRLAWDDRYLYVAIELEDSDIIAEGLADQQPHDELGDTCKVFLKPEEGTWYWELQITPRGRKTSYWYAGPGRLGLPSNSQYDSGLHVAAKINGTLNNWRDKDDRWTAEMAIPIRDLTVHGDRFGVGSPWRILIARCNYSRYLTQQGPELTTRPTLSKADFHMLDEYGILNLAK